MGLITIKLFSIKLHTVRNLTNVLPAITHFFQKELLQNFECAEKILELIHIKFLQYLEQINSMHLCGLIHIKRQ